MEPSDLVPRNSRPISLDLSESDNLIPIGRWASSSALEKELKQNLLNKPVVEIEHFERQYFVELLTFEDFRPPNKFIFSGFVFQSTLYRCHKESSSISRPSELSTTSSTRDQQKFLIEIEFNLNQHIFSLTKEHVYSVLVLHYNQHFYLQKFFSAHQSLTAPSTLYYRLIEIGTLDQIVNHQSFSLLVTLQLISLAEPHKVDQKWVWGLPIFNNKTLEKTFHLSPKGEILLVDHFRKPASILRDQLKNEIERIESDISRSVDRPSDQSWLTFYRLYPWILWISKIRQSDDFIIKTLSEGNGPVYYLEITPIL